MEDEHKNENERYLNVTIQKPQEEQEEISISLFGIFRKLKRFFALWLAVTMLVSMVTALGGVFVKQTQYQSVTSLVSFTYDGIEKGVAPDGSKFNANSIKSPQIIEDALTKLDMPLDILEKVRKGISIKGIIPQDTIEKLTAYKNIFAGGGSMALTAADLILEDSYYSTQYQIYFDYAGMGLTSTKAAELLNQILESYGEYFFKTYGFNQSLGSLVKALDYTDYDYAEAIDVFDATLSMLKRYVENISSTDMTRFRSLETGYTFSDLSEAISTIKNIDLDMISSYVTFNVVTKDKDALTTYYQYTLERLERQQIIDKELLATIDESIKSYEKNTVMVFGATGTEGVNVSAAEASAQYDSLFTQKTETQRDLSNTVQQINLYNKRLERLKSSSRVTSAIVTKVEEDLAKLNTKVNKLLEDVNRTADEYYETVVFSGSYNILVPANSSVGNVVKRSIQDSVKTIIILDAVIFIIYFGAAVILSCSEEYHKFYGTVPETGQGEFSENRMEKSKEVKKLKNKKARR